MKISLEGSGLLDDFSSYEELVNYYRLYKKPFFEKMGIYCERHHILPRCMGGDNKKENLVYLPWPIHCLAHFLLAKQLESVDTSLSVKNFYAVQLILDQSKVCTEMKKEELLKNIRLKAIQLETQQQLGNRVYVNNGVENLTVLANDLSHYLNSGWVKGRLFHQFGKGTTWMNDGKRSYQVKKEDVEDYLKEGFQLGMYKTECMKEYNHSNKSTGGRIAIHKGPCKKYVKVEDLNSFLEVGWGLGTGQKPRLGATVPQDVRDKISKGLRKRHENKISNL